MAEGLPEDGMLYTFEINDEQEDFTRPWLENSVYADKIKFYIGNALEMVPQFDLTFDLAFIDGDKRRYIDYYEMVNIINNNKIDHEYFINRITRFYRHFGTSLCLFQDKREY